MVTRFRDASDIQLSLGLYRLLELLGNLERLLTICVLRCDPALPAIFITETSCPKLRFRMSPNARHPITKLITSSSIQAFPRRLTLSESSRIKLFLDLSGRRHRKQGFDSPRLQTPITEQFRRTFFSQGRSLPDIVPSPSRDDVGHSFQESARSAAACCVLNACWTSSL